MLFIVMECLTGQTLKHLIQGEPMELERLLGLGIEVADALEAAHSKGIVHRDIKPANIFVTDRGPRQDSRFRTGQNRRAAKAASGDSQTVADATSSRPDQPRNRGGHGRLHVARAIARERNWTAAPICFLSASCFMKWQPASCRSAERLLPSSLRPSSIARPTPPIRLNPELPSKLEEIISKALEKDRDIRCQTAAEMRADLKRLKRSSIRRAPAVVIGEVGSQLRPQSSRRTSLPASRHASAPPVALRRGHLFVGGAGRWFALPARCFLQPSPRSRRSTVN